MGTGNQQQYNYNVMGVPVAIVRVPIEAVMVLLEQTLCAISSNPLIVNWQLHINNHTALLHSEATLAPRLPCTATESSEGRV